MKTIVSSRAIAVKFSILFLRFALVFIFVSAFLILQFLVSNVKQVQAAPLKATVCGTITTNTTWSAANNPYVLDGGCGIGGVIVGPNATLTIQAGVIVKGNNAERLEVQGHLEVQGTSAAPVIFTSDADNGAGQWSGIWFNGGDGHLNYTTIRYAGWNAHNLEVALVRTGGQVFIENSSFTDDSGFGMVVSAKSLHQVRLVNNTFARNSPNRILLTNNQVIANATLAPQAGLDGYAMDGNLTINTGISLTLQAGTVVMGNNAEQIEVKGHLEAQGTAAKPVIFTSEADNGSGQWSGIWFNGGDGHLNYTTIRYAGWNANNLTVTLVRAGGQVFIENSSFTDDSGFGMVVSAKTIHQVRLVNNTFSNNALNQILLTSNQVIANATLVPQNGLEGYAMDGNLTINTGISLTLQAGTVVMGNNAEQIEVKGHLEAQGTAAKPVIFTSEADNGSGQWSGIWFNGGDGHLNYTTVRYAGWNANNLTVTLVRTGGQVFIENSSFMDDSGFGMVISAKTIHQVRLVNNTFTNNALNRILLTSNQVIANATLVPQNGLEGYAMDGNLTINTGISLVLQAGTIVMGSAGERLEVKGHLEAQGTAAKPVIFTSELDNGSGQWSGIWFNGGDGHLNHAIIRYAGWDGFNLYATTVKVGGEVLVENSEIFFSSGHGILINTGKVTLNCVNTHDNGTDGIHFVPGAPTFRITNSSIQNNNGNGVSNENTTAIDARNTWWGVANGPGGSGPGTGDQVNSTVLFNPWLTAAPPANCDTVTPTPTPLPPTATPTKTPLPPTATYTPLPPTATPTKTPLPPTATYTPLPPTLTPTKTPLPPTATYTPLPPTLTPTNTPLPPTLTPTKTPLPPTPTPTVTATPVTGCLITINKGAAFTKQRIVQVQSNLAGATQIQLSNDGGFPNAVWQTYQMTTTWTLMDVGQRIATLVVHARFRNASGALLCNGVVATDEIIFDPQAPVLNVAVAASGQLHLMAEDQPGGSGVAEMEISQQDDFADTVWEPWQEFVALPNEPGAELHIRVRDGAGNESTPVSVQAPTTTSLYLPVIMR